MDSIKITGIQMKNMKWGITILVIIWLVTPFSPVFWKIRNMYYEPQKQDAMHFLESLVPLLEKEKLTQGKYPESLSKVIPGNITIPNLVDERNCYTTDGSNFLLFFWNPGDFWNDFWAINNNSNFDSTV